MDLSRFRRGVAGAARLRVRQETSGLTINGKRLWTQTEDDQVRSLYPDYAALLRLMPHRTRFSIKARGSLLGVARKRREWLASEVSKLRRLYPTASSSELVEAFPGRDLRCIYVRAENMGLRRPRKRYARTGIRVLDALRDRAFELRLTMRDLDALARSRCYFRKRAWKLWIDYRAIARAIEALDGTLTAEFSEL